MAVQCPFKKKYVSKEEPPFSYHDFLQQQDWDLFVQETNSPSFQQLSQVMKCIISHTRRAEKVIVVKGKSGRRRMQS
jgi:succinate dehydrogenase flavin-adding protein (antitoxin of CptAB toxin-antitoxin module)